MGRGGGGGAGGFRTGSAQTVVPGQNLQITVGAGGAGIPLTGGTIGIGGGDSSIVSLTGNPISIISSGGGYGGSYPDNAGGAGGSGGGATGSGAGGAGNDPAVSDNPSPITGQGFAGGGTPLGGAPRESGGGGGGASAAGGGGNATDGYGAHGGNGRESSISGVSTFYAGGGGGAGDPFANRGGLGGGGNGTGGTGAPAPFNSDSPTHGPYGPVSYRNVGRPGEQSKGGGGGGGTYPFTTVSGSGGSGIVILKFTKT